MASISLIELVEFIMTPSKPVILVGLLIVLVVPFLVHLTLVKSTPYSTLPCVLLLGPSGAGKTAFLTLLERGTAPADTHTSQVLQSVEFTASSDPEVRARHIRKEETDGAHTKFLLIDTPGHGKLRQAALATLPRTSKAALPPSVSPSTEDTQKVKAVVFFVDASSLGEPDTLAAATEYLHDVLLVLQKRTSSTKTSRAPYDIPVLIAANKLDLFTALPAGIVRSMLEAELGRIRSSRSRGLLDSNVVNDDDPGADGDDADNWLGAYGTDKFTFQQMHEFDVYVDVVGGNVVGDGPGVDKWWAWITGKI